MEQQAALLDELSELFTTDDPYLLDLATRALKDCIINNLQQPEGNLKRNWFAPGSHYYGHWIWDTMFCADMLSVLPQMHDIVRDAFRVYWDFQDFWNKEVPDYAKWMVANNVKPNGYTPFSQSECLIAWGMERIFLRTGDMVLLEEGLDRLAHYHDWYWSERDLNCNGLITVGTYAPIAGDSPYAKNEDALVQSARFESFDFQPPLDNLKLTPHPDRGGPAMYGDICLPDATAFLIQAEEALGRMALHCNRPEIVARCQEKINKGAEGMRTHMWDEEMGMFVAVERDTLKKIRIPAISGFIPLFAGVPTEAQAERMVKQLMSHDWQTPLPFPTVARSSEWFGKIGEKRNGHNSLMWRGDVWNPVNYLICTGLAHYGYQDFAASVCDKTVKNVLTQGFNECYHPDTGIALQLKNLGMSCTALTMLIDGLTSKYKLSLKTKKTI